jgi:hypothetical protein
MVPFAEGTGSHQEVNAKLSHILGARQAHEQLEANFTLHKLQSLCEECEAKLQFSGVVQIDKRPKAPLPKSIGMHPDPSGNKKHR